MLIIIGVLLIVSGAACIVFDMGMKAAEKQEPKEPAKEEHKDDQPEE